MSLGGGELGHRLGALGDGVLRELAREDQPDGGLDLARGDGRLLVVAREPGGLEGDLLEDVVDERVHDAHRLGGDAGVRVHLLEHLVDVDLVGLDGLLLLGLRSRMKTKYEDGREEQECTASEHTSSQCLCMHTTTASTTASTTVTHAPDAHAFAYTQYRQTRTRALARTLPEPPLVVFFAGFLLAGFLSAIVIVLKLLGCLLVAACLSLLSRLRPLSRVFSRGVGRFENRVF